MRTFKQEITTEKLGLKSDQHLAVLELIDRQWSMPATSRNIRSIGRVSKQRLFIRDLLFIERFTFSGDDVASL